ncbi:hypothetical protein [Modestobacter sp. URMC 112]
MRHSKAYYDVGGASNEVSAIAEQAAEVLSPTQSLSTLLASESFLLATVSLTATLIAPGRRRTARLPIPGAWLAGLSAGAVCLAAVGAAVSWFMIFGGGSLRPLPEAIVAVCIFLMIAIQPVLAVALAMGLRTES